LAVLFHQQYRQIRSDQEQELVALKSFLENFRKTLTEGNWVRK